MTDIEMIIESWTAEFLPPDKCITVQTEYILFIVAHSKPAFI